MDKDNAMEKDELFITYLEALVDEIIHAKFHIKLWKCLKDCMPQYHKELDQTPAFWILTTKAHLDAAIVHLFKIIDKSERSDPLSIWKFLRFIDSNRDIFSTAAFSLRIMGKTDYREWVANHKEITHREVTNDQQALEELQGPIKRLWDLRCERYAHIDRGVLNTHRSNPKIYTVSIREIGKILETVGNVLDKYSVAFDSTTRDMEPPGDPGVEIVMDSLRFKMDAEREERLSR